MGSHSKIISDKVLSRLDKEAKASVCNVIYYKNLPSTVIKEKSLRLGRIGVQAMRTYHCPCSYTCRCRYRVIMLVLVLEVKGMYLCP